MSKILYLTTAQDQNNFANFINDFSCPPNLSSQNFHNKLIRAIALTNDVDVISLRPINQYYKNNEVTASSYNEENIHWMYPRITKSIKDKITRLPKEIDSYIVNNNYSAIVVETNNLFITSQALRIAKKLSIKTIGVCTDNPKNISFASNRFKNSLIQKVRKLDSFICLTNDLNSLFNKKNKPYVIIDGINEELRIYTRLIKDDYIYFGGSLMEKYGVFSLIEAYKRLKNDNIKLVLCGHHEPEEFKKQIDDNPNIIYLGAKTYNEVANLEHYSLCCVNPRPLNNEIDKYSVPSKVLEYLANGGLTISTLNPVLNKNYSECIIWAKSSSPDDLFNSIKHALSFNDINRKTIIDKGKKEVLRRTSLSAINSLIEKLF